MSPMMMSSPQGKAGLMGLEREGPFDIVSVSDSDF